LKLFIEDFSDPRNPDNPAIANWLGSVAEISTFESHIITPLEASRAPSHQNPNDVDFCALTIVRLKAKFI